MVRGLGKRARSLIVRIHFICRPVVGLERNERQLSAAKRFRFAVALFQPPVPHTTLFSLLPQLFI